MPLERDTSAYAVIAREMLNGRSLYSDLWDHKPPGIHVAYAFGILLFGYSGAFIGGLWILLSIAITVGLYAIVRAIAVNSNYALLAAALGALYSSDLFLESNAVNTELFIAAFLLVPFAELVWPEQKKLSFIPGISLGIATIFKQVAIVPYVLGAAALLLSVRAESRKVVLRRTLLALILSCVPWFLFAVWTLATHRTEATYDALMTYNQFYAGSLFSNLLSLFSPTHFMPRCCYVLCPALLLAVWGASRRPALAGILLGTFVAIAAPGKFYNHYYELLFVPVAIGAALALDGLAVHSKRASKLLAALIALVALGYETYFFHFTPQTFSFVRHGPVYLASEELGLALRDAPSFYQLGNESGLYFYSKHSPPVGTFYFFAIDEGPLAQKLFTKVMQQLSTNTPPLVVATKASLDSLPPANPLRVFLLQHYHLAPQTGVPDYFALYVRNSGA